MIFGYAWYSGLCGVFNYRRDKSLFNKIISYKIDFKELKTQIESYHSNLFDGVIYPGPEKNVENFNHVTNTKGIVKIFDEIISLL